MPEVWTYDIFSRHFMPRSNTMFQLFILLCSIINFMFLFNWRRKITDFLEDQQTSLEKSGYEAKCVIHSASANVYFVFVTLLLGKFKVLPLSANFDDGLELYIFFKWIIPVISHFFQRIRLPLYTFPSILELEIYTFPWNHYLFPRIHIYVENIFSIYLSLPFVNSPFNISYT